MQQRTKSYHDKRCQKQMVDMLIECEEGHDQSSKKTVDLKQVFQLVLTEKTDLKLGGNF